MAYMAALLMALVFFLNSGAAGASRHGTVKPKETLTPVWRVDLASAIGSAPVDVVVGLGAETHLPPQVSLWFLNNYTLVASFVVRGGSRNLSGRDSSDTSLPLRLRAIIVDTAKGKVTATSAWPTESRTSVIVATHDGRFVAQTGNRLTLYSSEFKELCKLELPVLDDGDIWYASPSPTGRRILLVAPTDLRAPSAVQWIWVNGVDLQIARSWKEIQSGYVGISDDRIAMTKCLWVHSCEPGVEMRGLTTDWKPVAPASQHNQPHPQFISDDLLFLYGIPTQLIQKDGEVVFTEDAPFQGCWWGGALPSADGRRFIVPSCKLTGAFPALDLGGHDALKGIAVYDAPFHGMSYMLKLKNTGVNDFAQLALSPDGSKLAILNNESLEFFELPPVQ